VNGTIDGNGIESWKALSDVLKSRYIYIYIYICVCVCVCVYIYTQTKYTPFREKPLIVCNWSPSYFGHLGHFHGASGDFRVAYCYLGRLKPIWKHQRDFQDQEQILMDLNLNS
jgi:hypothetical protein